MTTLDELRRANLQEQRRKAEAAAQEASQADPAPTPAAPSVPAAKSVVETPAPKPVVEAVVAEASAPSATHLNGNGHSVVPQPEPVEPEQAPATTDPLVAPGEMDEADRKARAIMDRFYRGLAHKVIHPTGVKTTVDMPPDLFWRLKRYCHDHNNVTVRQLFLDLVIAVLDEEGY